MAFWTYILRCADGRYHTGHTDNIELRIAQHQAGHFRGCWTYKRRPLRLVWAECFPTRYEALEAERRIGGWSTAKKEALIRGDWSLVSHFAKPPSERVDRRFSTSLETNGMIETTPSPFASSEVEKRASKQGSNP
jgi:putative endonuclease